MNEELRIAETPHMTTVSGVYALPTTIQVTQQLIAICPICPRAELSEVANKIVQTMTSAHQQHAQHFAQQKSSQQVSVGAAEEPTPAPALPSWPKRAASFTRAMTGGKADEQTASMRLEICSTCPELNDRGDKGVFCKRCGCPQWGPLSELHHKASLARATCPLNKWPGE